MTAFSSGWLAASVFPFRHVQNSMEKCSFHDKNILRKKRVQKNPKSRT